MSAPVGAEFQVCPCPSRADLELCPHTNRCQIAGAAAVLSLSGRPLRPHCLPLFPRLPAGLDVTVVRPERLRKVGVSW